MDKNVTRHGDVAWLQPIWLARDQRASRKAVVYAPVQDSGAVVGPGVLEQSETRSAPAPASANLDSTAVAIERVANYSRDCVYARASHSGARRYRPAYDLSHPGSPHGATDPR